MSSIINATTTNGLKFQPDNSGSLVLQTNNGTTAVTIDTSQNVGIGTSSFAFSAAGRGDLEIAGSSTALVGLKGGSNQAYIYNDGTSVYVANNSASGNIVFQPANYAERMRIDSSGRVTKPFQTAFLAQAVQTDTTYSGGGTLIPFPNEIFDIGNNYDASISRFTAPVTGIYLVSWTCWNSSATTSRSALYKNGSIYKSSVNSDPISTRHNGVGDQANGVTIPVQLSVGDYIEVKVYANAITQFWMNYFSAYLLG